MSPIIDAAKRTRAKKRKRQLRSVLVDTILCLMEWMEETSSVFRTTARY
jgi:hypothetical protein